MKKLFVVAGLTAMLIAAPAFAKSAKTARPAAETSFGAIETPAHAYSQSHESGDYKWCMKTDGSPGCIYNTYQQCEEDRLGRGGFCYSK